MILIGFYSIELNYPTKICNDSSIVLKWQMNCGKNKNRLHAKPEGEISQS